MSKEITVKAEIDSINKVTAFVERELEAHDCPMKVVMQIDVAIDELLSNIANYSYSDKVGEATVVLDFAEQPNAIKLTFIDSGIPYNPLEKEDPDVTLSAEERGIGGLGVFIVKKSMDDVQYRYEDGKNILTIMKFY